MGRQTEESVVLNLLDELQNDEAFTRNEAIKTIIKNKVNDQRIVDALIQLTAHDSSMSVRNFARNALDTFGVEHSEIEKDIPVVNAPKKKAGKIEIKPAIESGAQEKNQQGKTQADAKNRRDFWDGFGVWVGLNIAVLIVMGGLTIFVNALTNGDFASAVGPVLLWLIPLGINIGVMVYYGKNNRPQAVIGMLAAFALIFTICLCLSAVCFSGF